VCSPFRFDRWVSRFTPGTGRDTQPPLSYLYFPSFVGFSIVALRSPTFQVLVFTPEGVFPFLLKLSYYFYFRLSITITTNATIVSLSLLLQTLPLLVLLLLLLLLSLLIYMYTPTVFVIKTWIDLSLLSCILAP
jgi:hypothetical protein